MALGLSEVPIMFWYTISLTSTADVFWWWWWGGAKERIPKPSFNRVEISQLKRFQNSRFTWF